VRGDGSTAHEGIFDPMNGCFLHQQTRQGWRNDSCWARGQSWAMYGFSTAYSFTQERVFLETAERLAEYYIRQTPKSGIPPNDWDEPAPQFPHESSAAAIAACGMWKLAKQTQDALHEQLYHQYALHIIDTLTTSQFLAIDQPNWEGILLHGIYHAPGNAGVDESTIWGDYYLLEALNSVLQEIKPAS
jgi:unsaturated chondroitin disaccharide hydrolase